MAALNFPSSPTLNQIYTANNRSWIWDGTSWVSVAAITGGSINNTTIGATTPSTGAFTTLSATGATNLDAGTVSAPGLYLEGETGTGLYRIGANNHGYAVSGAKVLDIASTGFAVTGALSATGNVGIGTTSPAAKLDVIGDAKISKDGAVSSDYSLSQLLLTGATSTNKRLALAFDTTNNIGLVQAYEAGGTVKPLILNSAGGNVGIGTTSPSNILTVKSSASAVWIEQGSSQQDYIQFRHSTQDSNNKWGIRIRDITEGDFGIRDLTANAYRIYINSSGNVGIGTTSPAERLHVVGNVIATGNITAYYSDSRLKQEEGPITAALDKVRALRGFYYHANEKAQSLGYKAEREVGVSAQEVEAVLPELIKPAPIDPQYKTLDYARLVPLLIEAIKELSAEVERLKA